MKKLFFILLLLSSMSVFAQTKTFIREYTYQASDYDSKVTARVNALEEVKRLLLEEVAVFIQSEFEDKQWENRIGDKIESGEFTEKRLISITAGITQTEILEEKWTGVEYWLKAKIKINPEEMKKQLDLILQDKEKTEELEKARQMADDAREEIERLKRKLELVKNENEQITLQNAYKKNVDQLDATDWFNKGYNAGLLKEYDKAKSFYLRAIELNPDYSDAYSNLGNVYYDQENYAGAIKYYNKAIEINPDFSKAYYNLGIVYRNQGNYSDAIKCYKKAIELNPSYSAAYSNLGNVYDDQENYAAAIKYYNKAIEINPDCSEAYFNLGIVYHKQGNYSGTIECWQKSARLGDIDAQKFLRDLGQDW